MRDDRGALPRARPVPSPRRASACLEAEPPPFAGLLAQRSCDDEREPAVTELVEVIHDRLHSRRVVVIDHAEPRSSGSPSEARTTGIPGRAAFWATGILRDAADDHAVDSPLDERAPGLVLGSRRALRVGDEHGEAQRVGGRAPRRRPAGHRRGWRDRARRCRSPCSPAPSATARSLWDGSRTRRWPARPVAAWRSPPALAADDVRDRRLRDAGAPGDVDERRHRCALASREHADGDHRRIARALLAVIAGILVLDGDDSVVAGRLQRTERARPRSRSSWPSPTARSATAARRDRRAASKCSTPSRRIRSG